jgi:hypothetical protein
MMEQYMTDDPNYHVLVELAPIMIIQLMYAVVTFLVCQKQNWNAWLLALVVLIPFIGMLAFLIIFLTTLLKTLDRLNALEGKESTGR